MAEQLSKDQFLNLLEKTCLDMEAAQDKLQQLDAQAGDGDLGVTVKLGFQAVREKLPQMAGEDIGGILTKSGMAFNAAGASTFGTLMATFFLRAGRVTKGKINIGLKDFISMMTSAVEGIKERGKASPGERTMLDALIPALDQLSLYGNQDQTFKKALESAAQAAEAGAKSTAQMQARHGRAGWLGERSKGVPDAGAVAVTLMFRAFANHVAEVMQ